MIFKKILSLALAAATAAFCLALPAAADSGFISKDFEIKNGVLVGYTGAGGQVNIPGGVKSIASAAFYYKPMVTSVYIPDSVTSIGGDAFSNCPGLESVTLPDSVVSLGDSVFMDCPALESVDLGDGLTKIPNLTLEDCSSLESVKLPKNAVSIGDGAFSGDTSLRSVDLPQSLESVGAGAFSDSGLTSVALPKSLKSIGEEAFCSQVLESIAVDPANPYFKGVDDAVYSGDGTTVVEYPGAKRNIDIPDGVTTIGDYAFCYSRAKNITLPKSVKTLGQGAFCYSTIESIVLPEGVTKVGDNLFGNCVSLKSASLPESLKDLATGMFSFCTSLDAVNIPSGVTSIGDETFGNCHSLTSLAIPEGVTSIGKGALGGCGFKTVKLPQSLKTIGDYAFGGGDVLESVTIPASVTTIGDTAFGSVSVKNIDVDPANPNFSSVGGVLYSADLTTLLAFPFGRTGTFSAPAGVKNVADDAFCYSSLNAVVFQNGLVSIGDGVFSDDIDLKGVTIPASVTSIGSNLFGSSETKIYGDKGSYAESYSEKNGIDFVALNPTEKLCVDRPSGTVRGDVTVAGWAVSPAGIARVDVYVDGSGALSIPYGAFVSRPDVAAAFINEGYPDLSRPGFSGKIAAGKLKKGAHTLRAAAVDKSGRVVWSGEAKFKVS